MTTYEVEQKYFVDDQPGLKRVLRNDGWRLAMTESHEDDYFNHPCRDFAVSGEALRIRKIDGQASVTYKAAKIPGRIKARRELEWSLGPADADGHHLDELLRFLDFVPVATVRKVRQIYVQDPVDSANPKKKLTVVIDTAERLGIFAEIEGLVEMSGADQRERDQSAEIESTRRQITELAQRLGLSRVQPLSYLRMLLANQTMGG